MNEYAPRAETWDPDLLVLAERLRELGYEIESATPEESPGRGFIARRDLEDRAMLVAIDAGGRFRAALTWVVGEWPSRDEIAGVSVRVVDSVSRAVTITGHSPSPLHILEVVAELGTIAPWASVAAAEATPDGSFC